MQKLKKYKLNYFFDLGIPNQSMHKQNQYIHIREDTHKKVFFLSGRTTKVLPLSEIVYDSL